MTQLLIGCMDLFFSKIGCHYFWPGLIAPPKKTLPNTRTNTPIIKPPYLYSLSYKSVGVPHKSDLIFFGFFSFFATSQFGCHIPKETKTVEAPKNRRFYGKMGVPPPFGPPKRREGLWAKHMGLSKVLLGTPLGNTLGN